MSHEYDDGTLASERALAAAEEDTPLPDTLPPPGVDEISTIGQEIQPTGYMALVEDEPDEGERRLRRIENTMAGIERTFQHLSDVLGTMIDDQVRTNRNLRTGMDITRNFVVQLSGKKSGTTKALQRLCDELDRQRQGEEEAPE